MQKALVTMFGTSTWVGKKEDPKACLDVITTRKNSELDHPSCHMKMRPHMSILLEKDEYSLSQDAMCHLHAGLWNHIVEVL